MGSLGYILLGIVAFSCFLTYLEVKRNEDPKPKKLKTSEVLKRVRSMQSKEVQYPTYAETPLRPGQKPSEKCVVAKYPHLGNAVALAKVKKINLDIKRLRNGALVFHYGLVKTYSKNEMLDELKSRGFEDIHELKRFLKSNVNHHEYWGKFQKYKDYIKFRTF